MGVLTQILGLVLSLSILVILHEFGHLVFARIFRTRVEKFYLFFNPWFSIFRFRRGHTEYGLGWLPLGGYVKISGMIDESLDKEQMKQPPQPWEFRSKPAWQRLFIMLGGVVVNFILALFIYSMILFTWGEEFIAAKDVRFGYEFHPYAKEVGLQDGDIILKVDDIEMENHLDIFPQLLIGDTKAITILRGGEEANISIPPDFVKKIIAQEIRDLMTLRVPFIVDSIIPGGAAAKAGIMIGDSIVAVNGISTPFYHLFEKAKQENAGNEIRLTVFRNSGFTDLAITVPEDGYIGIGNRSLDYYFPIQRTEYSFLASIPAGIRLGVETLVFYVKQLKLLFSPEGAKNLGGFGTIGGLFPKQWDWNRFWTMTAFLSVILAFMNILPIPALDGGHVTFLVYEIIVGRKPGDKFMEYAQVAGMIILLAILLFANANDVIRWFSKS